MRHSNNNKILKISSNLFYRMKLLYFELFL